MNRDYTAIKLSLFQFKGNCYAFSKTLNRSTSDMEINKLYECIKYYLSKSFQSPKHYKGECLPECSKKMDLIGSC